VIFSGSGSDGTLGAKEVRAEGGVTIAQDEQSSGFTGMPSSAVRAGAIDLILPPAQIASELVRIARHAGVRRRASKSDAAIADSDPDLTRIYSLLRALHTVDFSHYKPSTLKRRIPPADGAAEDREAPRLRRVFAEEPAGSGRAVPRPADQCDRFLREPQSFEALKKKVFPRLLKQAGQNPIRIWVPGCSTGEEVYSLAIALFEFLGKEAHGKSLQLFGTDISESVLAKARAGVYPEAIAAQVSPERLRRYFQKTEGGYQISKFVRDCCVFARQNVIEDPPFSKIDLISCRNVLIYLGPILQKKVMPIFHYALKNTGVLILGGSETIGGFSELFTLADKKNKIYSKRDGHVRADLLFVPKTIPAAADEVPKGRITAEGVPLDLQRHVDKILLSQFAPAGVVVNADMEVLQFRGQTGPYLEHSPGHASLHLMKMVRQELIVDLRTSISRAMKTDVAIRKEGIRLQSNGKVRAVNLEVIPFRETSGGERFFIVLFADAPAVTVSKVPAQKGQSARELARMREELDATKESLQAIIEEQEATNEELKSANEEIQSSNEELQSTNEELETAKEELQSTNEELTTLNEELQTRNIELSQANNDLSNLLSSVSMPILMLGNDLTIRRFTPLAERFFNLLPTDVGRRITDINPNIKVQNLEHMVLEVIESLRIQETEVQDREGRWYSLRIRPYRTAENRIDGAVVMLVDIDEFKRGLEELINVVGQPLLTLGGDLMVVRANQAFFDHFQTVRHETEGRSVYEVCHGAFNVPRLHTLLETMLPEKNRVDGYRIEQDFPGTGRRRMMMSARRVFQPGKGTQMILLAIEDQAD
jgi:two-component system CheB/CheR fusion protein